MKHPRLTAPLQICSLTLRNRIVMPPMVTDMAQDDGLVTQAHLDHYRRSSGPGLVIVEAAAVLPEGRISRRQLGIYADRQVEGLARLAEIIHSGGAAAGVQVHHAGALAFQETGKQGFGQKFVRFLRLCNLQLTVSGLGRIREAFGSAARRAVDAGFDIIELHAAHGYLFSQFFSSLKNRRIDRYGGSPDNRRRFLLEVFRTVCAQARQKALVTCRLGVADRSGRGLSLQEGLSTARALESEGIKLLDVSSGNGTPGHFAPVGSRYSDLLHLAREVKSTVSVPIIGVGGIRHPDLAEQALQDGMADLIAVGRGILADPGWARKTLEGRPESIMLCRDCEVCFYHSDPSRCPARQDQNG